MTHHSLHSILASRPVLLDGATGTMLSSGPHPDDDAIANLHRSYLQAGADIITTHTFCAQFLSHPDATFEANLAASRIARVCADSFSCPAHPRFVAGSVGPSAISLSACGDPANTLTQAYLSQISGLIRGGADIILIETITDPLNARAACAAFASAVRAEKRRPLLMLSFTICNSDTILPSGHTLQQAMELIAPPPDLLSVGVNCSTSIEYDIQALQSLSSITDTYRSICPNAGMPRADGSYPVTPLQFACAMQPVVSSGLARILGGCCGTTPAHTQALYDFLHGIIKHDTPNIL